uniref:Uncharacterized protein n=1 Tax=Moniliophthora roreri TaxID=221103 RepID=A0A0W0F6T0_MONRR
MPIPKASYCLCAVLNLSITLH